MTIEMYSKKPNRNYDAEQFRTGAKFISISQYGGKPNGFDQTLDYDLDEMRELRLKLLECQARGECRRP